MLSDRFAWRRYSRAAFVVYALMLFGATHWPALQVPGEGRKDLIIHVGAFAVWTAALLACGFFGPVLSVKNILTCMPIAVIYAAIDEGSQAIPWIRRTAAWDDYAADVSGIAVAIVLAFVAATVHRRKSKALSSGPS